MSIVWTVWSFFLGGLFTVAAAASMTAGQMLPAVPLVLLALLCLPPARRAVFRKTGRSLHPVLR
jgi:hypothetical protein